MKAAMDFRHGIKFEVGSGTRIRFWNDRWCTNRCLMLESPSLFSIARNKDAKVTYCCVPSENGGAWRVDLRRRLNDWEIGDMTNLIEMIDHVRPQQEVEDTMRWLYTKNRIF